MEDKIKNEFIESIRVINECLEVNIEEIKKSADIMIYALKNNKKILVCGNGGSAADAQHFVAELVVKFEKDRKSIPAIALTTDTSILTACSNDYGYKEIFKRQIESLGNKGDIAICITTSGNSKNILEAIKIAKEKNLKTICLNGNDGGQINKLNMDSNIIVPSYKTSRIQEAHITIIHSWCKLIEDSLF